MVRELQKKQESKSNAVLVMEGKVHRRKCGREFQQDMLK